MRPQCLAITVLCATLTGSPRAASAETPDALLAYTPADASLVVATPSIDELDHAISQLIASLELRTASTVSQALTILGLDQIVDTSRGVALAVAPRGGHWALRIPIRPGTDAFTTLNAGAPDDRGVRAIKLAGLSGFAMPDDNDAIAIVPTPDAAMWMASAKRSAPLPEPASQLVNGAPVFIAASPGAMRGALDAWGAGALVGEEVRGLAGALRVTGFGVTLDLIAPLDPASDAARACVPHKGAAHHTLLRAMPGEGYLIAASIDAAHPFIQHTLERLATTPSHARPIGEARQAVGALALTVTTPDEWPNQRRLSDRFAVRWSGADPPALAQAFNTTATSYVASLNGRWSQKTSDDGALTWAAQAPATPPPLAYLDALGAFPLPPAKRQPFTLVGFGAITADEGRAVAGKRSPITQRHLSGETTPTLADDTILKQMPRVLPGPRDAEVYLEARPLLEATAPIFTAAKVDASLPEWLAPIGIALDVSMGHPRATVFLPMGVLRAPAELALQQAMEAMGAPK